MRFLDKLALALFSLLALLVSIIGMLLIFGWIDVFIITNAIQYMLNNQVYSNVVLVMCVVFILLAIKTIFFESVSKDELSAKEGILLENDNGKLLVTKDTLENLANSVVKSFDSAQNVISKVLIDKENFVRVNVVLYVNQDVIIKELTANLQSKIKETMKKTIDLDIKEVNVKVKNITQKKVVEASAE